MLEKSYDMVSFLMRAFSSGSNAMLQSSSAAPAYPLYPRGMIEMREYTLKPEGVGAYTKLVNEYGDLRRQLLPLMG